MGKKAARDGASTSEPREDPDSGGGFQLLQPNRDPRSNWELDLAEKLEEYLLKICSGEVVGDGDQGVLSLNFAEAALMLQGSIQIYSRKVEYLYTLVVRALGYISQNGQDQDENALAEATEHGLRKLNIVADKEIGHSWGSYDVPEEEGTLLNEQKKKDDVQIYPSKPPSELLVLEEDSLSNNCDAGELESFLLSTCNIYLDFMLLDTHDGESVIDIVKVSTVNKESKTPAKGSSVKSKTCNVFSSPRSRHRSSAAKKLDADLGEASPVHIDHDVASHNERFWPNVEHDSPQNDAHYDRHPDPGYSDAGCSSDRDDDDDTWKPLNPHEAGNLRIKPPSKGKHRRRKVHFTVKGPNTSEFPVVKWSGILKQGHTEALFLSTDDRQDVEASKSPPIFDRLRESFAVEEHQTLGFNEYNDDDDGGGGDGGHNILHSDQDDFDMPRSTYDMDDGSLQQKKKDDGSFLDGYDPNDDPYCDTTLEDLCRSHMETMEARLKESEKRTELAKRVSDWKNGIEHALDEQDSRSPFDIHLYCDKIKNTLSTSSEGNLCFSDVVKGQEKHEVARTFSALLQMVNNCDVDLDKGRLKQESFCYTAESQFNVRLLANDHRANEETLALHTEKVTKLSRKGSSPNKSQSKRFKVSVKHGTDTIISLLKR